MTFSTDPPAVGDISLIPNADEKADLNAPAGSGGKLVVGQAPNITITETTVVADAAERLALDVQEGDVAIQTNVSTSFIFTGGDNVANNWQTLDFDAVGAIAGEDIAPGNVTASGNMSMQDLTVAGAFNGADTSAAAAGEALTSDGSGGFSFVSVGGDILTQMTDFLNQASMSQIAASASDMQDVINTGLIQNVAASSTAMQEVAASQTAMQEVTASETAMQAVASSQNAMQEVINSPTAMQEVRQTPAADSIFHLSDSYATTLDAFASINTGVTGGIDDIAASNSAMQTLGGSETAMEQMGLSPTARAEIENSTTAHNALASVSSSISAQFTRDRGEGALETIPETDESYPVFISDANYDGYGDGFCVLDYGWYENNSFIAENIGNIFVNSLQIGWKDGNEPACGGGRDLSGSIDAVIF
jgi:hypothetical protein